jgi:hypothetical protein
MTELSLIRSAPPVRSHSEIHIFAWHQMLPLFGCQPRHMMLRACRQVRSHHKTHLHLCQPCATTYPGSHTHCFLPSHSSSICSLPMTLIATTGWTCAQPATWSISFIRTLFVLFTRVTGQRSAVFRFSGLDRSCGRYDILPRQPSTSYTSQSCHSCSKLPCYC